MPVKNPMDSPFVVLASDDTESKALDLNMLCFLSGKAATLPMLSLHCNDAERPSQPWGFCRGRRLSSLFSNKTLSQRLRVYLKTTTICCRRRCRHRLIVYATTKSSHTYKLRRSWHDSFTYVNDSAKHRHRSVTTP